MEMKKITMAPGTILHNRSLAMPIMHTVKCKVLLPDPTLEEGKGVIHIEQFLGCTGCSGHVITAWQCKKRFHTHVHVIHGYSAESHENHM